MKRSPKKRTAAVTVEFALGLPILLLITFAGLEFSRVNMIRNTAINAAYEGARKGIVPGADAKECEAAADELLSFVDISGGKTKVIPSKITSSTESVTVIVTVPVTASNAFLTPQFFLGKTIEAEVTLPREILF